MSLRIKNARILTQDAQRRQLMGDVLVEEGKITQVGEVKGKASETIDAEKRILLPGLVNTHTHLPMVLLRGYGDDLPLEEWLKTRIWPVEDKMDESVMRVGARLAALELIAGGTTTFSDFYFYEDAIAEETAKAGLRGYAGWGMVDVGKVEGDQPNPKLPEAEVFLKKWSKHERIRGALCPHAAYTCTPSTYRKSAELAATYDTLLHTHAHETRTEVYDVEREKGLRPLAYLEKAGALGPRTLLAHCGWITKEEVKQIGRAGAKVSHNPTSNMKLATGGTIPLPELLAEKATVGLGTDGASSNNALDMFEAMKLATLLQKHSRWDAKLLPAQASFDLATRGGAACLRWEKKIGSIEVGKRADLVLLDVRKPHLTPWIDPVSQLVYAARPSDVHATIVDGAVLKLGPEYRTLKFDAVLDEAQRAADRLLNLAAS